jgi:hypothetical protein
MEVGQGPNWGCSAKGKKKLSLYLTNYARRYEDISESGRIDSHCLDLDTSWR